MNILALRTDKPEAELYVYTDETCLQTETWQAHRQLAETIHYKIDEITARAGLQVKDIQGIVVFEGPGSFTGLRIGITVANALAYSFDVPIVATGGESWIASGIRALGSARAKGYAQPRYGSDPHITKQKK